MSPRFLILLFAMIQVAKDIEPVTIAISLSIINGFIGAGHLIDRILRGTYVPSSTSGCEWVSKAPFCYAACDSQQVLMRTSSSYNTEIAEPGYGRDCPFGNKAFCCKANDRDPTWGGRWTSGKTGKRYNCKYYSYAVLLLDKRRTRNFCGFLNCFTMHPKPGLDYTSLGQISGDRCNRLKIYDLNGKATNGHILFTFENGTVQDVWFK